MKAVIGAVDRWFMAPAPAERLAAVRIFVGAFTTIYLVARLPHLLSYSKFNPDQFAPTGVVSLLSQPLSSGLMSAVAIVTIAFSILFTIGLMHRWLAPVFALLLLWTITYANSWGMIFHTENLMVLHVIALALSPAGDALAVSAPSPPEGEHGRYGWPLRVMCLIVVVAYVLAGIAKLRWGGWDWIAGDVLRDTIAVDSLRKHLLGSSYSPLAPPLLSQGWLFSVMALGTVVVELGAVFALVSRKLAWLWVFSVIGFHFGVLALMAIGFVYPMTGVAFVAFFRSERLYHRLRSWLARLRRQPTPA